MDRKMKIEGLYVPPMKKEHAIKWMKQNSDSLALATSWCKSSDGCPRREIEIMPVLCRDCLGNVSNSDTAKQLLDEILEEINYGN